MAGVASNPNSPRQKMINMMYLVFIAMLALNVSSEVLDGFELVENSLRTSTQNSTRRNEEVMANLNRAYEENEAKVGEWHERGVMVKTQSDELYNYIDELKLRIVQEADGKKGDVENIKQKDNLEASSRVMLAPIVGEGKKLRERIESYRSDMSDMVGDPGKKEMFDIILNTEAPSKAGTIAQSWEHGLFENMPLAAAVTLLTKLQNDIRFVEGETLSSLLTSVDVGDYRVNLLKAFVVPKSQIVTSTMPYEAQIVLMAVDSFKKPDYYLGSTLLKDDKIYQPTSGTGPRSISGHVLADGVEYPFSAEYQVTESSATIAPTLMEFLYESIDNPLRIAMSGVPSGAVKAELRGNGGNGKLVFKENNTWTVSGLSAAAETVEIVLTGTVGGNSISSNQTFKVRQLPPPQAFLSYQDADGRINIFRGGAIAKRNLILALERGVGAAIDDGVLNVPHKVNEFVLRRTDNRGTSIPTPASTAQFTQEQRNIIREMPTGTRFYISGIVATDPAERPVKIDYALEVVVTN